MAQRERPVGVAPTSTLLRLMCGLVLTCLACATVAGPTARVAPVAIDSAALQAVVPLTAALIRSHAQPGRKAAFDAILDDLALSTAVRVEHTDDALLATVPGRERTAPAIVMVAHVDVIGVTEADWTTGPFDGVVLGDSDGSVSTARIVGRGSLDMLAMAALMTTTLRVLASLPPARSDVMLLVVADAHGAARAIVDAMVRWPALRHARVVFAHGGGLIADLLRPGEDVAAVAVADQGQLLVRLHTQKGADQAAADRLLRALSRLARLPRAVLLTPQARRQLAAIGDERSGLEALMLKNPDVVRTVAPELLSRYLGADNLYDTCTITAMNAITQDASDVPLRASADVTCHLLPATTAQAMQRRLLLAVDDPRVRLEVVSATDPTVSSSDAATFSLWVRRLKQENPGIVVAPVQNALPSDCQPFRAQRIACFGFTPVRVTTDALRRTRGSDESVFIDALQAGLPRLVDVVFTAAAP